MIFYFSVFVRGTMAVLSPDNPRHSVCPCWRPHVEHGYVNRRFPFLAQQLLCCFCSVDEKMRCTEGVRTATNFRSDPRNSWKGDCFSRYRAPRKAAYFTTTVEPRKLKPLWKWWFTIKQSTSTHNDIKDLTISINWGVLDVLACASFEIQAAIIVWLALWVLWRKWCFDDLLVSHHNKFPILTLTRIYHLTFTDVLKRRIRIYELD